MLFMPDLSSHHGNKNELIKCKKYIFCGFVRTKSLSKGDICGFAWNIVGGLGILFFKKELAKIIFLQISCLFCLANF